MVIYRRWVAVEYELITASTKDEMSEKIERRLTSGWEPLGAPFIDADECFYQAIVRKELTVED